MGKQRPKHAKWEEKIVVAMSANALVQLLLDIIVEALHLSPSRINHLSLTFLNAFISFKTLSAIQKNRFSFMHEDCQILWLMEICLILGDVWYVIFDDFSYTFIFVRIVFIVCSLFNFICVSYFMAKYELWSVTYKGNGAMSRLSTDFSTSMRRLSFDRNPLNMDSTGAMIDPPAEGGISRAEKLELDCTIRTDAQMDMEMQMSDEDEDDEPGGVEMGPGKTALDTHCRSSKRPFSEGEQETDSGLVEVDKPGQSASNIL
jgi:hypothetical protein